MWRDAGVFTALLEGLIAEGARVGRTDLSLISVDSKTVRAHHDAAGMRVSRHLMKALEEAVQEQKTARQKKGGGAEEQNGQDERRRIRRRRRLRLKEALLGRSLGGLTSKLDLAADRRCARAGPELFFMV